MGIQPTLPLPVTNPVGMGAISKTNPHISSVHEPYQIGGAMRKQRTLRPGCWRSLRSGSKSVPTTVYMYISWPQLIQIVKVTPQLHRQYNGFSQDFIRLFLGQDVFH